MKKDNFYCEVISSNNKKYLKKQLATINEATLKILQNEYEKVNLLKEYPFVPKIVEYNKEQHYILYEYIEGELLQDKTFYDRKTTRNFLIQLCTILEYTHAKNIIHCDLKPNNIMISKEGMVYVLDWGSSAFIGEQIEYGTIKYCSLSQIYEKKADVSYDIYAFGIIMYQLFTGENLFYGLTKNEIIIEKESLKLSITEHVIGAPFLLDSILGKTLVEDKNLNYKNVKELKQDLERI